MDAISWCFLPLINLASRTSLSAPRPHHPIFAQSRSQMVTTIFASSATTSTLPKCRTSLLSSPRQELERPAWLWSTLPSPTIARSISLRSPAQLDTNVSLTIGLDEAGSGMVRPNFRFAGFDGKWEPFKDAAPEGWHVYWKGNSGLYHPIQLDLAPLDEHCLATDSHPESV
jgi:hypothetical protein